MGSVFTPHGDTDLEFMYKAFGAGSDEYQPASVHYIIAGDYNNDGQLNRNDYDVWQALNGLYAVMPNDLTPGQVDSSDYHVWAEQMRLLNLSLSPSLSSSALLSAIYLSGSFVLFAALLSDLVTVH